MSKFDDVQASGEQYAKDRTSELNGFTEAVNDGSCARDELLDRLTLAYHVAENWQTCSCEHCRRKRDTFDPMRIYFKEPENPASTP